MANAAADRQLVHQVLDKITEQNETIIGFLHSGSVPASAPGADGRSGGDGTSGAGALGGVPVAVASEVYVGGMEYSVFAPGTVNGEKHAS